MSGMSDTDSAAQPSNEDPNDTLIENFLNFFLEDEEGPALAWGELPGVSIDTSIPMVIIIDEMGVPQEETFNMVEPHELARIEDMSLQLPEAVHFLNNLPIVHLDTISPDDRTCAICRESYVADGYAPGALDDCELPDIPTRLPCPGNHIFGIACVSKWLQGQQNCPCCRHKLFTPMPDIRTITGLECILGFLELADMRGTLRPQDMALKRFFWENLSYARIERARIQPLIEIADEVADQEGYGEPEEEWEDASLEEDNEEDSEEELGWYTYEHRRLELTDLDETGENSGDEASELDDTEGDDSNEDDTGGVKIDEGLACSLEEIIE